MTDPSAWPALERATKAEAEAQNVRYCVRLFQGIKLEVIIEEGDFWPILESAIAKHEIDLIVLGTRGRSGAAKFFLGSRAEQIFRRGPLRGVDVGPHAHGKPPRGGECTEILCATDFSPASTGAVTYAICLAQEFPARLTILHVIAQGKAG